MARNNTLPRVRSAAWYRVRDDVASGVLTVRQLAARYDVPIADVIAWLYPDLERTQAEIKRRRQRNDPRT